MSQPIRIGLLRLVDSAPVLVAQQRGIFAELGLDVEISVEPSWANLADKLTYGMLDAAVMLPPLVLAAAMGLRGPAAKMVVAMGLSQGGNTIVLGNQAAARVASPELPTGRLMLEWLRSFRCANARPPRFAVVHRFSTHNLLLRYWLAAAGADPERHIETVVIPPEQVADALADGRIEGFCAGAPWGEVAQDAGAGRILMGSSAVWPSHPEKCLALSEPWLEANAETARLLVRALLRARQLCAAVGEAPAIAALLAQHDGLALPEDATRAALPGGSAVETVMFHPGSASYPSAAHALWFLHQMRRWNWLDSRADLTAIARRVYRLDVLEAEGVPPLPVAPPPPCNTM
jgi:ABC-type nitrate/sulfonate/bicarbonate transport system substrate-binding protein